MLKMNGSMMLSRLIMQFDDVVKRELGIDIFKVIMEEAHLQTTLEDGAAIRKASGETAITRYAKLQQSIRLYYGRGARVILLRIGRSLWQKIVHEASLMDRIRLQVIRNLPLLMRSKSILLFIARYIRYSQGSTSVRQINGENLLIDSFSAASHGQTSREGICFVTLGLVQEALYWVTGADNVVEEINCRATGSKTCEFRVRITVN